MAALAGALFAHFNNFVTPESFGFVGSVLMVAMVAVGGAGRFWGGVLGALVLTALPELLRSIDKVAISLHLRLDASATEILVFGLSMVVVLMYFPGGLAGALGRRAR